MHADVDLDQLDREALINEVKRLRAGIRAHRDSSGHDLLRCIANCLETSRYYASKGNRPLADWWHDRAEAFAHRLASKS